jgi:hypothetical protein
MAKKINDSFILNLWEKIFLILSFISIFSLIRLFKKNMTYTFVEIWVLFNTILAFGSIIVVYYLDPKYEIILWVIVIYGALRIFEIINYQINVLLFDPYRAFKKGVEYKIKSPSRLVILLLHNYFEIVCWFTVVLISSLSLNNLIDNNWEYYLRINFLCISTFETEFISDALLTGGKLSLFAFYESIAGFIVTLITLARFIGLLPGIGRIEEI